MAKCLLRRKIFKNGYETLEEFKKAFDSALKEKVPVWIECIIDKDLKVLPMIPSGGTVEDIILN